jgi:hypothetical protein
MECGSVSGAITRPVALLQCLEATEYAETLNAKTWERFDWLLEPQEAYLAIRD